MPPRIRSPSYSDEDGSDDLDEQQSNSNNYNNYNQNNNINNNNNYNNSNTADGSADEGEDLSSINNSDEDAQGEMDDEEEEDEEDDDIEGGRRGGGNGDGDSFEEGSEGEDDEEYDELEEQAPNRRASTSSSINAGQSTSGVKIKFKLGGSGSTSVVSNVKSSPKRERWNGGGGGSTSTSASKSKGKGKSKKRENDMSDLSDEENYSDASGGSSASGTRLTARQRAKEMGGENGMELQSLPNLIKGANKPTEKLTDAELALKRSEVSRKRKSQSDKKLEDEKTETINRLLKKQAPRQRSKLSASTVNPNNQSNGAEGDDDNLVVAAITVPILPTTLRWISSMKSGEYIEMIGVPVGRKELGGGIIEAGKGYPGPRPPLKTRRLERVV